MRKFILISLVLCCSCVAALAQSRNDFESSRYVTFFPNPATVFIHFDVQKPRETGLALVIFNFMGRKTFERKNLPSRTTINLEDFFRGTYIYQVRDRNGMILESGKFQVVK